MYGAVISDFSRGKFLFLHTLHTNKNASGIFSTWSFGSTFHSFDIRSNNSFHDKETVVLLMLINSLFFLSSFLFLQQPCPDIKCEFYELLHQLLLHNWRYFFRASLLAYMSMAEETVENQAQFNSVMQVCNRFDPCCNLRASNKAWNHIRRCRSLISKNQNFYEEQLSGKCRKCSEIVFFVFDLLRPLIVVEN